MKRALTFTNSIPLHYLQRYFEEELKNSDWIVTLADRHVMLSQERVYIERMLTITPDAFKQHKHE
jgi:hypothetical protein